MPITIRLALATLGHVCATTFPQKWKGKGEHFFRGKHFPLFDVRKSRNATFHESMEERAHGGVEGCVG